MTPDHDPVGGNDPAPTFWWKQAIVLRKDLKMDPGKLVAQGAHAAVLAALNATDEARAAWLADGMTKVALKVVSEAELLAVWTRAQDAGLPCALVRDAGRTQIPAGTLTAVGIGPDVSPAIDAVTGGLKLL